MPSDKVKIVVNESDDETVRKLTVAKLANAIGVSLPKRTTAAISETKVTFEENEINILHRAGKVIFDKMPITVVKELFAETLDDEHFEALSEATDISCSMSELGEEIVVLNNEVVLLRLAYDDTTDSYIEWISTNSDAGANSCSEAMNMKAVLEAMMQGKVSVMSASDAAELFGAASNFFGAHDEE